MLGRSLLTQEDKKKKMISIRKNVRRVLCTGKYRGVSADILKQRIRERLACTDPEYEIGKHVENPCRQ